MDEQNYQQPIPAGSGPSPSPVTPAPQPPAPDKLDKAQKDIRNGGIAALVSGTVTLIFWIIGTVTNAGGRMSYFNDPWLIVDAALVFTLAFFVFKRSRVAAIILLADFIYSKIDIISATKSMPSMAISLVFVYYYAMAIRGTFVYHNLKPKFQSGKKSRVWMVAGIAAGVIVLGVITLGVLANLRVIPDSSVIIKGGDLHQNELKKLHDSKLVGADEQIIYYYSSGGLDMLEEGSILTDKKVVSYKQQDEKMTEDAALFQDIADVQMDQGSKKTDPTKITIVKTDGSSFSLELAKDNGRDNDFFETIKANLKGKPVKKARVL